LLLALTACGASPQQPAAVATQAALPALTGRVVDNAHLLSPEQAKALTDKSAALERATGHQLVVVTLPGLDGKPIEQWGLALGNGWGVGRKGQDDGVLLIVAPHERKARIEIGRGLQAALTNGEAATIMQDAILPRFKAGDMPGGIAAGVDGIIREIGPETGK
jgi:uncharacterized protein